MVSRYLSIALLILEANTEPMLLLYETYILIYISSVLRAESCMSLYTPLPRVRSISMFKAGVPGRKVTVMGRKAQFIFFAVTNSAIDHVGACCFDILFAVDGERRDHFNFVFIIFCHVWLKKRFCCCYYSCYRR